MKPHQVRFGDLGVEVVARVPVPALERVGHEVLAARRRRKVLGF